MNKQTVTIMDSALIQKSEPLRKMKDIPFTITQMKLIDLYLSCIDIGSEIKQTLQLRKSDYENIMELRESNWNRICAYVEELSKIPVKIPIKKDGEEIYKEIILFDPVSYGFENEYGKVLRLTCSDEAKDYFYCLHKYRYTKCKLNTVSSLNSKSSYLLFMYINAMRQTPHTSKEWSVNLQELRDDILDLADQNSYKTFKMFKQRVFNASVNEINEKTFYNLNYDLVKRGKNVVAIQFTFLPKENKSMDLCTNK